MDLTHLILISSAAIQLIALVFIVRGSVEIAHTAATVEETAKQIAEIVNRDEKMTMAILKKVYDVTTPNA